MDTLAAAYAESGDFDEGQGVGGEGHRIGGGRQVGNGQRQGRVRSRLELYKQGKPYREEAKRK